MSVRLCDYTYAAIAVYDSHELFARIQFLVTHVCPAYAITLNASLSRPVNKYKLFFAAYSNRLMLSVKDIRKYVQIVIVLSV